MGKRAETFQQLATGVQSIAVIIAAIIGAWWALRTYVFEHPKFYEEGGEVASVPFMCAIETEQMSTSSRSRLVSVRVTLSHKSHLTEGVLLSQNPLRASLVDGKPLKQPAVLLSYAETIDKDGKRVPRQSVDVPPEQQATIVFAFSPPEPGLYLIQFDPCARGRVLRQCIIQKYVSVR